MVAIAAAAMIGVSPGGPPAQAAQEGALEQAREQAREGQPGRAHEEEQERVRGVEREPKDDPGPGRRSADRGGSGLLGALDELLAAGELADGLVESLTLGDRRSLLIAAFGSGLTVLSLDDADDAAFVAFGGGAPVAAVQDELAVLGSRAVLYPALVGTFFAARALGKPGATETAADLTQALLVTDVLVTGMKLGIGRRRPDGSDSRSFPSGHTAGAFAIASVLGSRYGKKAGIPAYAFATLMGTARINDRRHFLSDVLGGAVIGILVGRTFARPLQERGVQVGVVQGPDGGSGVGFTLEF